MCVRACVYVRVRVRVCMCETYCYRPVHNNVFFQSSDLILLNIKLICIIPKNSIPVSKEKQSVSIMIKSVVLRFLRLDTSVQFGLRNCIESNVEIYPTLRQKSYCHLQGEVRSSASAISAITTKSPPTTWLIHGFQKLPALTHSPRRWHTESHYWCPRFCNVYFIKMLMCWKQSQTDSQPTVISAATRRRSAQNLWYQIVHYTVNHSNHKLLRICWIYLHRDTSRADISDFNIKFDFVDWILASFFCFSFLYLSPESCNTKQYSFSIIWNNVRMLY
jgi:hypothetical protein